MGQIILSASVAGQYCGGSVGFHLIWETTWVSGLLVTLLLLFVVAMLATNRVQLRDAMIVAGADTGRISPLYDETFSPKFKMMIPNIECFLLVSLVRTSDDFRDCFWVKKYMYILAMPEFVWRLCIDARSFRLQALGSDVPCWSLQWWFCKVATIYSVSRVSGPAVGELWPCTKSCEATTVTLMRR